MKHLLTVLISIIFLFSANPVSAQKEKYRFAFRTGLNLAYLKFLTPEKEELIKPLRTGKVGMLVGFSATARLNPVLSVKAELVYTQKGLRFVQEGIKISRKSMNYVEIPLSGHFTSSNKKKQFWDLFGGAYVGYWTDGMLIEKYAQTGFKAKTPIKFETLDGAYNRVDIGFLGGASYFSRDRNWAFDLRYEHGFSNNANKYADPTAHRVFSLGVEYIFAKRGKM